MTDAYPWRPLGDCTVRVAVIDTTVAVELKDKDGMAWALVDDPEQLRHLAALLLAHSQDLQDRIDIAEGMGGDR